MINSPLLVGKGGRQTPVACNTSTKLAFAGGNAGARRTGVILTTYTSAGFFKITNLSDSDPAVTSTDYDIPQAAGSSVFYPLAGSIGIWAQSGGNVSGVEVYQ